MSEKETEKYDYLYICTRAQSSTFILSETNARFARCILVVIIIIVVMPTMVYVLSKTRTINVDFDVDTSAKFLHKERQLAARREHRDNPPSLFLSLSLDLSRSLS